MKSSAEVIELESVDAATPKLGEMLLAEQKLSRNDLERALEVQRSMGGRLGRLLISLGLVSEVDVYAALSRQAGLPLVRQDAFPKDKPQTARLNTLQRDPKYQSNGAGFVLAQGVKVWPCQYPYQGKFVQNPSK